LALKNIYYKGAKFKDLPSPIRLQIISLLLLKVNRIELYHITLQPLPLSSFENRAKPPEEELDINLTAYNAKEKRTP